VRGTRGSAGEGVAAATPRSWGAGVAAATPRSPHTKQSLGSGAAAGTSGMMRRWRTGALGVASRRRLFTVIVTDKAVLVYRNGRRADSPSELLERHVGHASLGPLNGTMECSIDVGGTTYNVQALWSDEVRKINRALGRSITGS
jgi:hypothetical protein